jgi:hypothetical protein
MGYQDITASAVTTVRYYDSPSPEILEMRYLHQEFIFVLRFGDMAMDILANEVQFC